MHWGRWQIIPDTRSMDSKTACILTFEWPSNDIFAILNYPDQSPVHIRFILRASLCYFYSHQSHCHGRFSATIRPLHTFYTFHQIYTLTGYCLCFSVLLLLLFVRQLCGAMDILFLLCPCVCTCTCMCMYIRAEAKQVAQLSQRDRAAGWVSFRQKWKTGIGRQ